VLVHRRSHRLIDASGKLAVGACTMRGDDGGRWKKEVRPMSRVAPPMAPLLPISLGASAHPEQVSYRKPIPLAKNWRDAFRGINALVHQAIADRRVLFVRSESLSGQIGGCIVARLLVRCSHLSCPALRATPESTRLHDASGILHSRQKLRAASGVPCWFPLRARLKHCSPSDGIQPARRLVPFSRRRQTLGARQMQCAQGRRYPIRHCHSLAS
jgi:hypothetical protein